MRRGYYVLGIPLLASLLSFVQLETALAADEASDALKKCDALASHPHDPGRYAAGVTDEQFAPGAAIEACEPAAKLNPDVARAWFELGRSYWIGQRDKEAFAAFVEAAKRNYAPAMKFLGDAYLEGRGLPSGQAQDGQTALKWYQKSADGRFADGIKAVEEVQAYIKKKGDDEERARLEAERAKFEASIFQNPQLMSRIYAGTWNGMNKAEVAYYVQGFINTIGGTEPFFVNGQNCIPLVAGTTTSGVVNLVTEVMTSQVMGPGGPNYFSNTVGNQNKAIMSNLLKFTDQGHRDAITLFNRYGCDSAVAHTVVENINIYFDPSRKRSRSREGNASQTPHSDLKRSVQRSVNTFNDRGIARVYKGEYDDAIGDFNEAIRLDPRDAVTYNNRGVAWERKGEDDRAIADYNEAIRLDPKYADAYSNRGLFWKRKGDYDRAMADKNEVIRLNPKDASAYNGRGLTWNIKGEYDRAIADYDEAIRLDRRFEGAYNNRGYSWLEKGELDRAIADFNKAIRLDPKNAVAHNNRGRAWQRKGEYDRALADYSQAIRIAPKDDSAYAFRGTIWRLKGDLDRALADQTQAVALAPDRSFGAYAERGDTFRDKGEFERAIGDYEHALRIGPDYIPALTGLGLTYEKMGDLANARTKFEQALASQNRYRFTELSKSALDTANARLAALGPGFAQSSNPIPLSKATPATSMPTPIISTPTVPPATVPKEN
jgi:tetratricopeptide (TPR) repeat protein